MPIRVLHIADSHIGADLPRRRCHARPRRGDDFIDSYRRVLNLAYSESVDLVIHAGDVFNTPRPTVDATWAATEPLRRLAEDGIPVVVVPGNHERSALPAALLLDHPLIHILSTPRTVMFDFEGGRLAVSGFPYLRRATAEQFSNVLDETNWRVQKCDARILVAHQAFDSAVCGPNGYRFRLGGDDVIARCDVPVEFDYVAAGHIHRHQRLRPATRLRPEFVYAGSPDRIAFAEIDEPKGAVVVEFDGGLPSHRFIEHVVRPMSIWPVAVNAMTNDTLVDEIERIVGELPTNAVAQFRLTGVAEPNAFMKLRIAERAFAIREDVIVSYTIRGVDVDVSYKGEEASDGNDISIAPVWEKRGNPTQRIHKATPATVSRLPTMPGVYAFFDGAGRLLYVGKATNIRTRVRTHIADSRGTNFFADWTKQIATVEATITPTADAAFEIESDLIKSFRPPFNIAGRDTSIAAAIKRTAAHSSQSEINLYTR